MKRIIAVILFNYVGILYAQVNIKSPNLDASSAFRFTEIPVSLSNGLVNVNLPIYTIKTKSLEIPIQLNYHSQGVKVEDIASSVGLGWSLNYGGLISRQVKDRADDSTNGYLTTDSYTNFFTNIQKRVEVYNQTIFYPSRDLVPDQFYFSIPNYSGKFIFDHFDKSIVQQPFTDNKIISNATNNALLDSWNIIDEKGNKYYFGNFSGKTFKSVLQSQNFIQNGTPSLSYAPDSGNAEDNFIDTWYLIQIETTSGEIIKYNYNLDASYYYKKNYDKVVYPCIYPCDQPSNIGVSTSFSKVNENKYLLESIEFPEGKIKFLQSALSRQDIIGGKSLEKIQVYDNNNHLIEYIQLNYTVKESAPNQNVNPLLVSLDNSANKRMFLSQAIRYSKNNETLEKYNYNYNIGNLPNRFSTSQDMWGYYNNASNGSYLHFFDYNGHLSSNRNTDDATSKSGILESVSSITGLKTEFIYENNILKPAFNMSEMLGQINSPYKEKFETLIKAGDIVPSYDVSTNTYYKDIVIDPKLYDSEVKITLNYHDFQHPDFPTSCNLYTAFIEKNGSRVNLYPNIGANNTIVKGTSITRSLVAGDTYKLVIKAFGCSLDDALANPSESVSLTLDYKIRNDDEILFYGPGNRIKEIKYLDNNILKLKKAFEYKDADGNSSGSLFGTREYVGIIGRNANNDLILDPNGAMSGSFNSSLESNSLGYQYVKEYFGDSTLNKGRVDYEYTNFFDGSNFSKYPFTPSTDNQWTRGFLKSKKYYGSSSVNNNISYNLLRQELNEYKFGGFDSPYEISPGMGFEIADGNIKNYEKNRDYYVMPLAKIYQNLSHLFNGSLPHNNFLIFDNTNVKMYYKPYYYNSGKVEKYKSSILEYKTDKILESQNNSIYGSNVHYQITSEKTTSTDGLISETTYSYAHEKGNQLMIDRNMVGIPLETTTVKKQNLNDPGKTVSKTEALYPTSLPTAQAGSLLLPLSVKSSDQLTGLMSADVTYDKYDTFGNLQQYTTKDGIPVTIVWGYNNTQPIAKVEGITYDQLTSLASPTAIITASDNDAADPSKEGLLLTDLNTFRKNSQLTGMKITTYTYDPLIGVTSITPPSGIRQVFTYDPANRLKETKVRSKDTTGAYTDKKAAEYKYNYKP
jgi:hypothetical protein